MKLAGEHHNLLGFNYALQTVLKMVLAPSKTKNESKGNESLKGFEGGTNG